MKIKIQNLILPIVAIMALAIVATPAMATTNIWTDVNGNGVITVDNYGHRNVNFQNQIRVTSGAINFEQDIDTSYGHFNNDVRLHGSDLKLENSAGESHVPGQWSGTGGGWVPAHRQIGFSQGVYAGESSTNWDEANSQQSFYVGNDYIAQEVQVNPTANSGNEQEPDRLDMWSGSRGQSGMMNSKSVQMSFGGRASLSQNGRMEGDYNFAKTWTNMNKGAGSSVESWNNGDWLNSDQEINFA